MRFCTWLEQRGREILKQYGYWTDNPGGEWLKHEQKRARKAKKEGRSAAGTVTAGTSNAPILVKDLLTLPGQQGEHDYMHTELAQDKIDKYAKSMEKEGYKGYGVMVWVDIDGRATMAEGNHRVRAALRAKIERIPVEFKWWNGSENGSGPWSADNVANMI